MAAATQIVVCRVLLEHEPMPTNPPFTINVLLKRARGRKRSRPGIAKVQVMLDGTGKPNPVLTGDQPVGICVYDRKARSCADVTMLVKGVAEIECTEAAIESYKAFADPIKVVEKKANGIYVIRAFFDFSKRYQEEDKWMTITPGIGIEASENHLVQTLNFHNVNEAALGNYQVGMPVEQQGVKGIMLWPLSTKSIGKGPSNPYAKAAVLTEGVVTLYIENAHEITPLTKGNVVYNGQTLRVAVLEVYQSSIRVQLMHQYGGEFS